MSNHIAVVGLGYVGLPLAISAFKSEFNVIGIDSNIERIESIKRGVSPVEDISSAEIKKANESGLFFVTSEFNEISKCQTVVICVPTPLTEVGEPDLAHIEHAIASISRHIEEKVLIIIESTIATGTTRNKIQRLIESKSGLNADDFYLAYSPERIDPSNKSWNIGNTPKLVSGITDASKKLAVSFYKKIGMETVECDSVEIAETAKLLENSFRLINVSFINELSIFCNKINIDINKVISAAATKPYGFMPFYPSVGVGGHCIPIDPLYLAHAAEMAGAPSRIIELAYEINQEMPDYIIKRAEEKISGLSGKMILVIGVAYKSNVSDVRETSVESLITGLRKKGAIVFWHDELVKEWNGEKSTPLGSGFDLAILATPHDNLNIVGLGETPILNTRSSI